jgi:hypothetical protein
MLSAHVGACSWPKIRKVHISETLNETTSALPSNFCYDDGSGGGHAPIRDRAGDSGRR